MAASASSTAVSYLDNTDFLRLQNGRWMEFTEPYCALTEWWCC
ncbi:hypothetical protein Lalb_Chr06g0162371 [Lupinus albus]|uniref:Uncharacterized protein n=1 Tax=Lupinus albus TaxID=3870 RepID=A0A6A4QBS4_LUPAL|nr:hypothetical protein Lalb_Chr06g0162371 [Lupinus albus]